MRTTKQKFANLPFHSLIPCKISPGMFANEYAVSITLISGEVVTLFADQKLISKNGSQIDAYLNVNVVKSASGEPVVLLPTEALETGSRWIQVDPGVIQHK